MNRQYSFLLEGPIGDNLKISVAHKLMKYPSGGDANLFWQNVAAKRKDYAKQLLSAKRQGRQQLMDTRKRLLDNSERQINRWEDQHGQLPQSHNPFLTQVRPVDLQR